MKGEWDAKSFQRSQAYHLAAPVRAQPLLAVNVRENVLVVGVGRHHGSQCHELAVLVFGGIGEVFQGEAMIGPGHLGLQGAQQVDEGGCALVAIGVGVNFVTPAPEVSRPLGGDFQRRHPLALMTVQVPGWPHLGQA